MEKDHESRNILFLESGALSMSLDIWIAFFTIYGWGRVRVGKQLANSLAHVQKIPFLQKTQSKTLKENL